MNYNSHGADIYSASKSSGIEENSIIDFSSNINPLGVPRRVEEAVLNSIRHINRYPDINSRDLVKSISSYEKVDENMVFCSNGAAESIFRIPLYLKPKKALLTAPTFSEYENALKVAGCNMGYYNLSEENNYKIGEDILAYIDNETDIVFICNPNNPTGQVTDNVLLEKIIARCKSKDTTLVIDECFIDFLENKSSYSVKHLLRKYDNLIILKAFTKIYAIPGLRLGYCLSSNIRLIEGLKESGPPWNVSNLAQAGGISALKEEAYLERTVSYVKKQREFLLDQLRKLHIKVYESYGNYILFKIKKDLDLRGELLEEGILIRSCSNYNNLTKNHYRIAVKREEENKIFVEKLKKIWLKYE